MVHCHMAQLSLCQYCPLSDYKPSVRSASSSLNSIVRSASAAVSPITTVRPGDMLEERARAEHVARGAVGNEHLARFFSPG
eukprot:gene15925-biopygen9754